MSKTLLELMEIKGSLEHLLKPGNWFGPTEVLEKALKKAEKEIKEK